MAPPLPLLSPQKMATGEVQIVTIRLLNSSRTKEALKIFRTGFFSSGTRSGVRQKRHRRRLKTRTGGVLEWFSLSLSGAIFHSAGQNATFCICVAYFVINTQGCSAGVFTQAPINNPSVWRGGQGLRGITNKKRKHFDHGTTGDLLHVYFKDQIIGANCY